jgi:hypothetical protein
MTAVTALETVPSAATEPHPSAIAANLHQHAEAARGAYARNTERALQADVAIFTGWCIQAGQQALRTALSGILAKICYQ